MFHVKRVVGDKYEILDSDSNSTRVLDLESIKAMVDAGAKIKGVAYICGELTVTPVPPLYSLNRKELARNKLIKGNYTGVKGFDLDVDEDKGRVIAKSLTREYVEYILEHSKDNRFVLAIPDIVTDISSDFVSLCFSSLSWLKDSEHINVCIDLPLSLKNINTRAFSYYGKGSGAHIVSMRFNGVADEIDSSSRHSVLDGSSASCTIGDTHVTVQDKSDVVIRSRVLNPYSVTLNCYTSNHIYLPDTEILKFASIRRKFSGFNIHLGRGIRSISNFLNAVGFADKFAMDFNPDIVFIPDGCELSMIDFSEDGLFANNVETDLSSYIAVLSESMYEELVRRYESGRLRIKTSDKKWMVGILTYRNQEELDDIEKNISNYTYNRSFSEYFTSSSIGKFTRLRLRDKN